MKRTIVTLGLLLVMGGSAYGGEGASQGGQHHGPPPEAYTACEGKTEGSTASLIGREGETISGICKMADGKLVLRPNRGQGNHQGPPPEAYKACEGKSAGSVSQLVTPWGETVKGTCEAEDGKMVLRPDGNRGGKQGQANSSSGKGRTQ